jgi:DNA repair exonuclease SbcCD ATPase subunit
LNRRYGKICIRKHQGRFQPAAGEAGDIDIELDETFTPIVIQSGYLLALDSLSGGEKTSVAFTDRFALNTLVNSLPFLFL